MNDTSTIVLVSICWPILLVYGVQLTNRKCEPFASVAHIASVICLLGPLTSLTRWLHFDFDHVGWWILTVIPAAVVINLLLVWAISARWPHCKECGTRKLPSNYTVGRGTPDEGYVVIATCPKCDRVRQMSGSNQPPSQPERPPQVEEMPWSPHPDGIHTRDDK